MLFLTAFCIANFVLFHQKYNLFHICIDFFLNDFETSCNMDLLFWKGTQIKNINYVHQLQNLYFSLTGEELIFTKDK